MEPAPHYTQLSLLQLLQNILILRHTCPYIGINGLISLAATAKAFRKLLFETPHVFQRVNLSGNKSCTAVVQKGDSRHLTFIASMLETQAVVGAAAESTLEEHLARPLDSVLGHLKRLDILQDVRTLILDGLAVPGIFLSALLCGEIKNDVRLLSLREVEELSEASIAKCLRYLIRSSRPKDTPKLKGLYYFTKIENTNQRSLSNKVKAASLVTTGVTNSTGAQLGFGILGQENQHSPDQLTSLGGENIWYRSLGEVHMKNLDTQLWGDLLEACKGLIAFDATICRHDRGIYNDPRPKIANIRLAGCQSCGSSPEGELFVAANRIALATAYHFI